MKGALWTKEYKKEFLNDFRKEWKVRTPASRELRQRQKIVYRIFFIFSAIRKQRELSCDKLSGLSEKFFGIFLKFYRSKFTGMKSWLVGKAQVIILQAK